MRPWYSSLSICLPLLAVASAPAQDRTEFEKDFGRIQSLTAKGRWKQAHSRLEELLGTHAGKDYVLARRLEIAEEMKRCIFYSGAQIPGPKSLVSGKLVSYKADSGKIKLRYDPTTLEDFREVNGGTFLQHHITFDGDYSIAIKGKSYPASDRGIVISVCDHPERSILVIFGCKPREKDGAEVWIPSKILLLAANRRTVLAQKEISPIKAGQPYTCQVRVTRSSITSYYNNRKILQVQRKKEWAFGSFGFAYEWFKELLVVGDAQTSWMQGLQDAAMQDQRLAFEKNYKASAHLPPWMLAEADASKKSIVDLALDVPGAVPDTQRLVVLEAFRFFHPERSDKGLEYLSEDRGSMLPEVTRNYLLARLREIRGELKESLDLLERVIAAEPDFVPGHFHAARLYFETLQKERAIATYDALLGKDQVPGEVYQAYVMELLRLGFTDKARQVISGGRDNPFATEEVAQLQRMLVMAEKGPSWTQFHETRSKNYHVVSDISKDVCNRASRILEEAFLGYRLRLTEKRLRSEELFRVYVFSGEAGYRAYVKDIIGADPRGSAGLYSPILKQLLIWNLPEQESMLRTIRHEGFHQFLDRVTDDAPTWFNEGLAEYYERGRRVRGFFTGGQIRPDHLGALRRKGAALIPLESFLHITYSGFYARADRTYPQAWALVHFLRHGTGSDLRDIFRTLMDGLQNGKTEREAIARAFEEVSIEELERRFAEYLASLSG